MVTALIQDGCRNVIFDLSELSQIDSTGIGRFIAGYRQMMAAGGVLRMAAPSDTVRAAFHVTRLDSVFPFFETLDEALRAGQE